MLHNTANQPHAPHVGDHARRGEISPKRRKDITEISAPPLKPAAKSAAPATALFKRGVTAPGIVSCAFLRIGQHFIGFFNLFKFSFGLFITLIAVG